jgi:branched-chain amino acid transport system substrate-binding protein
VRHSAIAVLVAAAAAAIGFAGCGSKPIAGDRIPGATLTIYSSLPMHGASSVTARAVVAGEALALSQIGDRIGKYRIVLRSLDDSTAQRGTWDPGQTTVNARTAAQDKTTIGYIGELNSGASAVAIPLLNRVGIPEISPASTAIGLTSSSSGASPGEPQKYYPTKVRTYARVMPNDAVQAGVQVKLQRAAGCKKTFVVEDGEVDGEEMATSFQLAARAAGLDVVGVQSFERNAADYRPFAASIAQTGADCLLISAITDSGAVAVTRELAATMPKALIFGSDGLAETTYTEPERGGIPTSLDSRVLLTGAAPGPAPEPAAQAFYTAYGRSYGVPEPDAIYGYEAMSLLVNAISRATHGGHRAARRTEVREAIFGTRDRRSALGTYSIDRSGDTTIRRYGVYKIVAGRLRFWKEVDG